MSNISAVICELNPLHRGHEFLFDEVKKTDTTLVAIMSGNFVQRGECAIFHKYARAKAALECGADLVLELPFPWCCAPAEFFALGAMSIVKAIGADSLFFGSECGNIDLLKKAAYMSKTNEFKTAVENEYKANVGFAVARERAAEQLAPETAELFSTSNDMLALEYIAKGDKLGYNGEYYAVRRFTDDKYMSASTIRRYMREGKVDEVMLSVPCSVKDIFEENKNNTALLSKLEDLEFSAFRLGNVAENTFDCESGILSRIKKYANSCKNGREMLEGASTKKYTDARIRRAALFALCGITKAHLSKAPGYTVLLAANENGRTVLSDMRKKGSLEIITKPSAAAYSEEWERQAFADSLYTMLFENVEAASYFLKSSPIVK